MTKKDYKQIIFDLLQKDKFWFDGVGDTDEEGYGLELVAIDKDVDRRWYRAETYVISAPDGRYYAYAIDRGLTEEQEHELRVYKTSDIIEVYPSQRMIVVTDWLKVENS